MNNTLILNSPLAIKNTFSLNWRAILKLVLILNILLTVFLLVFYIFQINKESSERYLILQGEKEMSSISKENQLLELNLSEKKSLDNITALINEFNFEKIDKIHYIKVVNSRVVAK